MIVYKFFGLLFKANLPPTIIAIPTKGRANFRLKVEFKKKNE